MNEQVIVCSLPLCMYTHTPYIYFLLESCSDISLTTVNSPFLLESLLTLLTPHSCVAIPPVGPNQALFQVWDSAAVVFRLAVGKGRIQWGKDRGAFHIEYPGLDYRHPCPTWQGRALCELGCLSGRPSSPFLSTLCSPRASLFSSFQGKHKLILSKMQRIPSIAFHCKRKEDCLRK